ncbi:MAG: UvrD-helicase domain-containing protein [Bacteroidaceae bacterium]|nr:UvrD-helicase domain-containing protein [Bacteroidaceae bacterium]
MIIYSASAGTGKTYTLATRYIALLMDSTDDRAYRHVLAVTFTNKATAEMKQRILSYLFLISKDNNSLANSVRSFMRSKPDNATMAEKAERIYHNILADYDDMCVSTIDAFLQQLITGMAQMLGIGADFGVEVDTNHAVSVAVDEVMTEGRDDSVNILADYLEERMDDDKGWDVRKDLICMTEELLKEAVLKDNNEIELNPNKIKEYKNAINWRQDHAVREMRDLYEKVKDCRNDNEIDSGSNFYYFIDRVGKSLEGKADNKNAFRGLGVKDDETLYSSKFTAKVPQRPEIQDILQRMQELTGPCRRAYLSSRITSRYLNDLAMMSFVNDNMKRNLEEANTILLARTAYVLQSALNPGYADFILEKAGIRYHHIMIDEFQDTSTLQWAVFCQLISEILASGGTTLIVGDVKQSIYRWRNGDYRIMQGLKSGKPEPQNENNLKPYVKSIPLTKNYRSQAKVVEFNHELFEYLCRKGGYAQQFADIYCEVKKDENGNPLPFNAADFCNKADKGAGYVQVKTYVYKNSATEEKLKRSVVKGQMLDDVFADLEDLIKRGAAMSDILILARTKNDAKEIINHYAQSNAVSGKVRLCSNDSFLLESSRSVMVVVSALKYIATNEALSGMFLKMCGISTDCLGKALMRLPLNELVEKVIKLTLFKSDGKLRYDDISYLNYFVDEVGNYVNSYGSNVNDFLVYWDDQLHAKPISASGNEGVRIMTIHTAKGLESKYVFIPFCDWALIKDNKMIWHEALCQPQGNDDVEKLKLIPAEVIKEIAETDYRDAYEAEHEAQSVDNLNLLYVAFTRAADQLYVYADVEQTVTADAPKTVGDLVKGFIGTDCYCKGEKTIIADSKHDDDTPFEHHFKDDEMVGYSFFSGEEAIRFRQSQESLSYMQSGAEDTAEITGRINAGNLRHDIFAHIVTMADTDRVINDFYTKGIIESQAEAKMIAEEMERAWKNPQMADWFGGGWRVLREVSVLRPKDEYEAEVAAWKALPADRRGPMPKRELRPDRVMVRGGEAVVLDFKFGKHNHAKYSKQVEQYKSLLSQMGYEKVEGYLWYGHDGDLVKV